MTRKEAIEVLQNPHEMYCDKDGNVGYTFNPNTKNGKAFDMAIKALEQETVPREHYEHEYFLRKELDFKVARLEKQIAEKKSSEDCVSRESANELFDSEIKMYKERIETRKGSNYHDETERIKEFLSRIANAEYWQNKIKALPPVTPTRKKGKWIAKESLTGLERYYECSNCGNHCLYEYVEIGFQNAKTKFCPNCGAEMEGEE